MKPERGERIRRWLPRLIWAVAASPVLLWWARRSLQADDALIAAVALAGAALVMTLRERQAFSQNGWYAAAGAMALYGAGVLCGVPATLLGLPLLASLVLTPGPWRRGRVPSPAVVGLLVLALPAVMMLELYFGYPLRLVASASAGMVLRAAGVPLMREGALLTLPGCPIWVDAPCSGIRMLWSGLWLVLVLCGLCGLGWRRTAVAVGATVVIVVAANGLRVTGLALAAAGGLLGCSWFHTGVGVASFAFGALGIAGTVHALRPLGAPARPPVLVPISAKGRALYLMVCVVAGIVAFGGNTHVAATPAAEFPGWPATFEGESIREGPLLPEEAAFASHFPGRVGRFVCGEKTVIIRWVTRPSHRVHSAGDCLRASGWTVRPLPLEVDPAGVGGAWGAFRCVRGSVVLQVREQCSAPDGRTWPDVSSWFWAAWSGRTAGPWQVVTVAVREPDHRSQ